MKILVRLNYNNNKIKNLLIIISEYEKTDSCV